jgi:hypothetical protein
MNPKAGTAPNKSSTDRDPQIHRRATNKKDKLVGWTSSRPRHHRRHGKHG